MLTAFLTVFEYSLNFEMKGFFIQESLKCITFALPSKFLPLILLFKSRVPIEIFNLEFCIHCALTQRCC